MPSLLTFIPALIELSRLPGSITTQQNQIDFLFLHPKPLCLDFSTQNVDPPTNEDVNLIAQENYTHESFHNR